MKNIVSPDGIKVLILAIMVAVLSGCSEKTPEARIALAKEYLQKQDHKSAILELKSAVQQQPNNGEIRLMLGRVYYLAGDYHAADKELKKARELGAPADQVTPLQGRLLFAMAEHQRVIDEVKPGPTLGPAALAATHAVRANAYLALDKRDEAARELAEGEKDNTQYPDLLMAKARLALLDQHTPQAVSMLDEALVQEPNNIDALYLKASLLGLDNKRAEAKKLFQQIIANNPREFRARLAMAQFFMDANDLSNAAKEVEAAEKTAPQVPIVKYGRAMLELRRGKLKEANDAVLQVLRVSPDHLPSLVVHTITSFGLRNYEQCRKSAERVLQQRPDELLAAKYLAASLIELNDPKGALAVIEPRLKDHGQDAQLLAMAGDTYLRLRNYDKATKYLEQAVATKPDDPDYLRRLAASHLAKGATAQAVANLEKAVNLSAKPGQADISLVMLYMRQSQYEQALKTLNTLEKKLPDSPVPSNLRGAVYLTMKDATQARKALEQALAIKPDYFPAAANLAQMDLRDKKPGDARKRFESVLTHDKKNIQAMMALAELAAADKNEKAYLEWLEKAANTDPKALHPGLQLVRFYLANNRPDKALNAARTLLNANPDNPDAMKLLGLTHMALKDYPNASSTFSRLIQLSPGSAEAHYQLALAQLGDKQADNGRVNLMKALELNPDLVQARDSLLGNTLSAGKTDEALQISRDIQTRHPKSPLGYEREGDIQVIRKDIPLALKAYEQALSRGAGSAGLIKLHRTLFTSGERKQAEQRMLAYIKANPRDVAIRSYAATIYSRTGNNRQAIEQYEAIVAFQPRNVPVLNELAELYQEVGDKRALATAEQALKLAPDRVPAMDTLGWILVQQGQIQRGMDLLGKASAKAPKNQTIRYHFAVALARNGMKNQAKQELNALVSSPEMFPEKEKAKALLRSL